MNKIQSAVKNLLIFVLLFGVISLAMDYWRRPNAPENALQQPLRKLAGERIQLAKLSKEKPVLLYFWGSWCSICSLTSPSIASLANEGIQVISVALKSGDDQTVQDYLQQHQYNFLTVNDPQGTLSAQWQIQVTPSIIIIKNGKIVHTTTGLSSPWGLKLRLWLS
ncbi:MULTISPECIES: protein disulfide oxidoreductase [unclassified Avibacterium]|uniref:protein disulfide oxidoreductase n=1 Tax=unclassified Avibacterium TaxID=2685287 RepID=UPI00218AEDF3|nr:redoxin domain-containing protein [Avibacterium sp. 20-129]MCW9698827.1 protein disulfide oxidoreductase [Avibacterium sp. 20-129]URL01738.1 protein disulfide oxidoreductase [Avibacterium sp. 20-126]